ncbi:MAG: YbaB/EbfC family nucleoid-associated protein [Solobacterium sp.]|nr:YbaB/EbfC family nucleoid-associated protein [Solobacterium sp.]
MDMRRIMEQAQKMQKQLKKVEQELQEQVYEGNSGGSEGVTVKVNGNNDALEVNIHDDLLDKDNKDMLQDMILLAFNNAVEQARVDREEKMGAITQGVTIPGL